MIRFESVQKSYRVREGRRIVLSDMSFELPLGVRLGILGSNGAGKSTLLRLMSGSEYPDSGRITRACRVSFPVGFTGTFHPDSTARQNVTFLARVYGMNVAETVEWVEDFAELGNYFDEPVGNYSSGMFARLAFGTSFAIDFEFFLVDEGLEVGDARFREKCRQTFRKRLGSGSLVMVSHNIATIRDYCSSAAILCDGQLLFYDSLDLAMKNYETLLRRGLVISGS